MAHSVAKGKKSAFFRGFIYGSIAKARGAFFAQKNDSSMSDKQKKDLFLFFAVVVMVNLAAGFSDGLFSNYFKEVYHTDGFHRGLIEFPRKCPA